MSKTSLFHFISEEEGFERRLTNRISKSKRAIIASAFFTDGAFRSIKPSLENALKNEADITFLLGRFDFITEPKAISKLLKLSKIYKNRIHVFFDADFYFHYKIACFIESKSRTVFIGSSNLTLKGLSSIGEINLEIVDNASIIRGTIAQLNKRLRTALDASDHLEEYEKAYNRARRYRRQRRRWEQSGKHVLTTNESIPSKRWRKPEGTSYPLCPVTSYVKDSVLKNNIEKTRRKDIKDHHFANQWIQINKSDDRVYKEGTDFIIRDDTSKTLGFAVCTHKFRALGADNKEQLIIFYRYRRGWRAPFKHKPYKKFIIKHGLSDTKEFLKGIRLATLIRYFERTKNI